MGAACLPPAGDPAHSPGSCPDWTDPGTFRCAAKPWPPARTLLTFWKCTSGEMCNYSEAHTASPMDSSGKGPPRIASASSENDRQSPCVPR